MPPKSKLRKVLDEISRVRCAAGMGLIREEIWKDEDGEVARYNLAFINHFLTREDNGRVLGYDNQHGHHHRHFKGEVEPFDYAGYVNLFDLCKGSERAAKGEAMKLTIRADGFEGWAKRGRERAEKLTRGEGVVAEKTINLESPFEMRRILTAERMRLLETTRKQAFSVTGLAAELGRDPKSVRRDVLRLVQVGVLRTRERVNPGHGRVKIVEPVAARVEMRASF